MDKQEITHYIKKYKEHEARRASTDERNAYWVANMKAGKAKKK